MNNIIYNKTSNDLLGFIEKKDEIRNEIKKSETINKLILLIFI